MLTKIIDQFLVVAVYFFVPVDTRVGSG
jgi:hypothetical protein